ncbi:Crp/Fnr family transcriptional regulator [Tenacibaculum sp. 190524A05c]|uniref:Crp/Fnr family transcriptional regulator n=1 Tax=Tenacibaculum platacis TaxID=3137852 RepID=UPI0032B1AA69
MQELADYIKGYIDLKEDTFQHILSLSNEVVFEKGEQILNIGKTCKHLYFLKEGSVRSFIYQKGKDITHWVYGPNSLFTSWGSYILQNPSNEYLEAIDVCKVVSISYDNWQLLFKEHPELERFGRLMMEQELAIIDEFYKGYYFLSAKEKYELLISVYPNITQIANLGHIASMLGISQETLSRIRST